MVIVHRVRGKTIRTVLCCVVYNSCANWLSWKFLTDGTNPKASIDEKLALNCVCVACWQSSCLEDGDNGFLYFLWWLRLLGKLYNWSQGLASLRSNCQLTLGKVHQVNRISVISELRVLLKCFLEICLVRFVDTLNLHSLHLRFICVINIRFCFYVGTLMPQELGLTIMTVTQVMYGCKLKWQPSCVYWLLMGHTLYVWIFMSTLESSSDLAF